MDYEKLLKSLGIENASEFEYLKLEAVLGAACLLIYRRAAVRSYEQGDYEHNG